MPCLAWLYPLLVAVLTGVTACATGPTASELATADYGPRPADHEEIVRNHFAPGLVDPRSAVYRFRGPDTSWANSSGGRVFGWRVCGTISARDRFGGLVGPTPFFVLIRHGRVVTSRLPQERFEWDIIAGMCR